MKVVFNYLNNWWPQITITNSFPHFCRWEIMRVFNLYYVYQQVQYSKYTSYLNTSMYMVCGYVHVKFVLLNN